MRTDQTALCVPCALRFARTAERCPSCGGAVLDLRVPTARRVALLRLLQSPLPRRPPARAHRRRRGCSAGVVVTGIVLVSLAAMLLLAMTVGMWAMFLAFFGIPTVATMVWVLFFGGDGNPDGENGDQGRESAGAEERTELPRVKIRPLPEVESAPGRLAMEGETHLLEPLVSPLGGTRCAAFRLVGWAGPFQVDDGSATDFEVTPDDGGESVFVEGQPSSVALEVGRPTAIEEPAERLVEFLSQLGIELPEGDRELRLAEAVLRQGDRLAVEGTPSVELRPQGYRGTAEVQVFRERPGSPLVLRSPRGE